MSVHELAFHLGMSVQRLMDEMTFDEMTSWFAYFEQRPIGWRDDLRTYHLLRSKGEKRRPAEVFPSLAPIFKSSDDVDPMKSLKTSFLFNQMLSAVGGDKLDL